jgi:DNA polymerase-3 subunit gamma/tau
MMAAAAPRAITFNDVVALASARRDAMLYAHLRQSVHVVRFAPPVIEMRLEPHAPRDLAQKLAALLEAETNRRWTIALSNAPGEPTLDEAEGAAAGAALQSAIDHPLVKAILETFPGAKIEAQAPPLDDEPELPADWAALTPPDELYEGDDE